MHLKSQASGLGIHAPHSSEALNVQQSFLRLSGEDGDSVTSRNGHTDRRAMLFFFRFGTLWGLAFLAVLAGTIIAFMNLSPVLTL